jgi:hypothetical protein
LCIHHFELAPIAPRACSANPYSQYLRFETQNTLEVTRSSARAVTRLHRNGESALAKRVLVTHGAGFIAARLCAAPQIGLKAGRAPTIEYFDFDAHGRRCLWQPVCMTE